MHTNIEDGSAMFIGVLWMAHKCIMAEQWLQMPVFCQPESLALHLFSPKNNIQILHILLHTFPWRTTKDEL